MGLSRFSTAERVNGVDVRVQEQHIEEESASDRHSGRAAVVLVGGFGMEDLKKNGSICITEASFSSFLYCIFSFFL